MEANYFTILYDKNDYNIVEFQLLNVRISMTVAYINEWDKLFFFFFFSFLRVFLRRQKQEVGYVTLKRTERIKGMNKKLNGVW